MKCPFCVEQGLRSKVYGGDGGWQTLMYASPYYDEDGIRHYHDPNHTTYHYHCSNLHVWTATVRSGCCEDYPREEMITRQPDRIRCEECDTVDGHTCACSQEGGDTTHLLNCGHFNFGTGALLDA